MGFFDRVTRRIASAIGRGQTSSSTTVAATTVSAPKTSSPAPAPSTSTSTSSSSSSGSSGGGGGGGSSVVQVGDTVVIDGQGYSVRSEDQDAFIEEQTGTPSFSGGGGGSSGGGGSFPAPVPNPFTPPEPEPTPEPEPETTYDDINVLQGSGIETGGITYRGESVVPGTGGKTANQIRREYNEAAIEQGIKPGGYTASYNPGDVGYEVTVDGQGYSVRGRDVDKFIEEKEAAYNQGNPNLTPNPDGSYGQVLMTAEELGIDGEDPNAVYGVQPQTRPTGFFEGNLYDIKQNVAAYKVGAEGDNYLKDQVYYAGAGAATSLYMTGGFFKDVVTNPIETGKEVYSSGKTIAGAGVGAVSYAIKDPDAAFSSAKDIAGGAWTYAKDNPGYIIGFGTTEVLTFYATGGIAKGVASGSSAALKLAPKVGARAGAFSKTVRGAGVIGTSLEGLGKTGTYTTKMLRSPTIKKIVTNIVDDAGAAGRFVNAAKVQYITKPLSEVSFATKVAAVRTGAKFEAALYTTGNYLRQSDLVRLGSSYSSARRGLRLQKMQRVGFEQGGRYGLLGAPEYSKSYFGYLGLKEGTKQGFDIIKSTVKQDIGAAGRLASQVRSQYFTLPASRFKLGFSIRKYNLGVGTRNLYKLGKVSVRQSLPVRLGESYLSAKRGLRLQKFQSKGFLKTGRYGYLGAPEYSKAYVGYLGAKESFKRGFDIAKTGLRQDVGAAGRLIKQAKFQYITKPITKGKKVIGQQIYSKVYLPSIGKLEPLRVAGIKGRQGLKDALGSQYLKDISKGTSKVSRLGLDLGGTAKRTFPITPYAKTFPLDKVFIAKPTRAGMRSLNKPKFDFRALEKGELSLRETALLRFKESQKVKQVKDLVQPQGIVFKVTPIKTRTPLSKTFKDIPRRSSGSSQLLIQKPVQKSIKNVKIYDILPRTKPPVVKPVKAVKQVKLADNIFAGTESVLGTKFKSPGTTRYSTISGVRTGTMTRQIDKAASRGRITTQSLQAPRVSQKSNLLINLSSTIGLASKGVGRQASKTKQLSMTKEISALTNVQGYDIKSLTRQRYKTRSVLKQRQYLRQLQIRKIRKLRKPKKIPRLKLPKAKLKPVKKKKKKKRSDLQVLQQGFTAKALNLKELRIT